MRSAAVARTLRRVGDARVVLVVEDDLSIRLLIAAALTEEGFEVREASSGEQALALARSARPDVVVLDVGLPDMDGALVAEQLRELHAEGVPIVVVTAIARQDQVERIRPAALFTKPFDLDELGVAIRRALSGLGDQPGTGPAPAPVDS